LMELLLATLEKNFITVFLSIQYQDRENTKWHERLKRQSAI
jgi:hypothetical protein